jgi:hypothetical protein
MMLEISGCHQTEQQIALMLLSADSALHQFGCEIFVVKCIYSWKGEPINEYWALAAAYIRIEHLVQ